MSSSAISSVNSGADVIGTKQALIMNCRAAQGLQEVLKSNLGPKGTMKMLVSGAGMIKLTKDGAVLLSEMQIQHPTAAIIARTATAQDDITGDGTTSIVLLVGELLRQSERYLESVHPRTLVDGFELAREEALKKLDSFKTELKKEEMGREVLLDVARTSLSTKVPPALAEHLTPIVVDAVRSITQPGKPIDLHMVEIMHMRHKSAFDTQFINGLVLDHGTRHPDMAKRSENCHILTLNVSLEYEKSTVNSTFMYKSAEERAKLVAAERKVTDDKVNRIIAFKKLICEGKEGKTESKTEHTSPKPDEEVKSGTKEEAKPSFIIINQKGIDPGSLDLLQKNGIVAIRRAKRRNMERLMLACGGYPVNSVDDLAPEALGHAKLVYEHVLGDEKYTFVEGAKKGNSCTILIKGPNDHTIAQIKDAVHDGLRAVVNFLEDKSLIAGAGAFELALHSHLLRFKSTVEGPAKIGVQAFADALLVIPKALASNAFGSSEAQHVLIGCMEEVERARLAGVTDPIGISLDSGKAIHPGKLGIWDNYRVKKQFLHLGSLIAIKLLLVDEVIRAGRKMGKGA